MDKHYTNYCILAFQMTLVINKTKRHQKFSAEDL